EGADRLGTAFTESAAGTGSGARAAKAALGAAGVPKQHDSAAPIVALASGCLGLVYFTEHDRRLTREQLEALHPGLLNGIVASPDVGFVLVETEAQGPVVLSSSGVRYLEGGIEGDDPLAAYGAHAAAHLLRTNGFETAP